MGHYAVVQGGVVINIIEHDGISSYAPAGVELVELVNDNAAGVDILDTYADGTFTPHG